MAGGIVLRPIFITKLLDGASMTPLIDNPHVCIMYLINDSRLCSSTAESVAERRHGCIYYMGGLG